MQPRMWWSRPKDLAIETEVTFSGVDLLAHVASASMFHFSHADPADDEEAELIADFLQDLQNYGDIHDEMGAGDRVREGRRMTEALESLLRRGFSSTSASTCRRCTSTTPRSTSLSRSW